MMFFTVKSKRAYLLSVGWNCSKECVSTPTCRRRSASNSPRATPKFPNQSNSPAASAPAPAHSAVLAATTPTQRPRRPPPQRQPQRTKVSCFLDVSINIVRRLVNAHNNSLHPHSLFIILYIYHLWNRDFPCKSTISHNFLVQRWVPTTKTNCFWPSVQSLLLPRTPLLCLFDIIDLILKFLF